MERTASGNADAASITLDPREVRIIPMERVRCATCGLVNFATEATCLRCGRSLDGAPREASGWDSAAAPPPPETRPPGERPRFQDTAQAGIWDPKAMYNAPDREPPSPPPPPYAPTYGPQSDSPRPAPGPGGPYPGHGAPPPYGSQVGFGMPQDQAARLILEAQKDARNALIGALVGLVTFCCFGGLLLGVFAIVKGNEARRVLDYYGVEHGRSTAVAATVVGGLDIAISIVFLIAKFGSWIL
jgi:hypothetical protein